MRRGENTGTDRSETEAGGTIAVQVLAFEGCPNRAGAIELAARAIEDTGVEAALEVVDVADAQRAAELRFLGSPTIRVDGQDVEQGADDRRGYGLVCRVYRTEAGVQGQPEAGWVTAALEAAARP